MENGAQDVPPEFVLLCKLIGCFGSGVADADETKFPNRYMAWTPRLLKAAYNYQFIIKDPGAYAHNSTYAIELLYDSLSDLGAKVG